MSVSVDLLIVGGGPAGAATAIWAAQQGLRVLVMERQTFPRHRPGETLHPGAESILTQLGVAERVAAASQVRHAGQRVIWAGQDKSTRFASDSRGQWLGYQVRREDFDEILLSRARECGVVVMQPCAPANRLLQSAGRICGIDAGDLLHAKFVVDATGGRGVIRRALGLTQTKLSEELRVHYGYGSGECSDADAEPTLRGDGGGWLWTARIERRRFTWARLSFGAPRASAKVIPAIDGVEWDGRIRGADVTWRFLPACAGPGYFVVGDAAAIVDPASSHGVLRALMSGMMAAHVISNVLSGRVSERDGQHHYRAWLRSWFDHDVRLLREFYDRAWPVDASSAAPARDMPSTHVANT
ncbi:NAD(P)/FAD-dependent oxidoreductase [Xanthobacter versatilis]|uniref:NAD(P)/FAD-dependent oxidoreductase n=1 Tax=Xanthobacter autotrophicus (strain ATCC BAA-1158 / Py2) TaxID=78245 RepID=UPI00372D0E4E